MGRNLRRLVTGGAAYQSASLVAGLLALITLPLYTRSLTPADFGMAETLLVTIILVSIVLRAGLGEAFVRYWADQPNEAEQIRLARTTIGTVAVLSTLAAAVALAFARPLSELLVARSDPTLVRVAIGGMWAFTNLEMAYALLRVREARRTYLAASLTNVLLTVSLTVVLVVVLDYGASGYLAGNYAASAVVLVGVWLSQRGSMARPRGPGAAASASAAASAGPRLGSLLRFGGPTVPAEALVFGVNVVDRVYLLRTQGAAVAGVYALAAKLATIVIVAVRAFGLAWPPLAYSIKDDEEAAALYAAVCTWYVTVIGAVVAALALLAPWLVAVLAGPSFGDAAAALPWVALGWGLYGLFLLLVTIGGRASVTVRNLPATALGLTVNVIALVVLAEPLGAVGAGIALCLAYAVMISALYLLTRNLFVVAFEWRRLVHAVAILGGVAVLGSVLLPGDGMSGFLTRSGALVLLPVLFSSTGFLTSTERGQIAAMARRVTRR